MSTEVDISGLQGDEILSLVRFSKDATTPVMSLRVEDLIAGLALDCDDELDGKAAERLEDAGLAEKLPAPYDTGFRLVLTEGALEHPAIIQQIALLPR